MDWIEIGGTVGGVLVACGSALVAVRKWISRRDVDTRVVDSWLQHFGRDPASAIREELEAINADTTRTRVVQSIIQHHLGLGVFVCDPTGRAIWVNEVLAEQFGRDSSQLLGGGWIASVVEADRERVWAQWHHSVSERLPYDATYTIRHGRTHEPWAVRAIATPASTKGVGDKVVCWVGYVTMTRIKIEGTDANSTQTEATPSE